MKRILISMLSFLFVSLISGQILMMDQSETASHSIKYGFYYVLFGCGIPQALSGESIVFIYAVIAQIVIAVIVFLISPSIFRKA